MSYYVHPIFGHRSPSPPPMPNPYYPSQAHRHPHPHAHAHPFGPIPTYDAYDLEAEERAALAHLRHIQQRREAEQAAIQREAAIRLRQQEEREAAIRQAIAQKQREQAIMAAIEKRKQEEAIRSAAIQQYRARQEQIARAKFEAYQQAKKQQVDQAMQKRVDCAKRCAARYAQDATKAAAKEVKKEYKGEMEMINGLLGGLFGINLKDEHEEKVPETKEKGEKKEGIKQQSSNSTPVPAPTPANAKPTEQSFPEDVNDLLSQFLGLRIEPTTANAPSEQTSDNKVPQGLNEFLSRFGLVFEPVDVSEEVKPESSAPAASTASEKTKSTEVPTLATSEQKTEEKVDTAPTSVSDPPEPSLPAPNAAASSSSAAQPFPTTAARDDHPLTTFFNGFTDMPPFVRDILGNVEMAFKEEMQRDDKKEDEVQGKGKGVAEGEKKIVPTPVAPESAPVAAESQPVATESQPVATESQPEPSADSASSALSTLSTLADNLEHLRSAFTFPSTLSFGPSSTSGSQTPTPALLFNKTNSAYHAQAHNLLQLLLAADGVSSGGNKDVRRKRKEIVRQVEKEIERLEERRDGVWEKVKELREMGEEVEGEEEERSSGSGSCASSSVDPEERHEVEQEHIEDVKHGVEEVEEEEKPLDAEMKETYAEVAKEDKQEKKEDKDKEEEGYELV